MKDKDFNIELKLNVLDKDKRVYMPTILKTCANALEGHGYIIYANYAEDKILIDTDRGTLWD